MFVANLFVRRQPQLDKIPVPVRTCDIHRDHGSSPHRLLHIRDELDSDIRDTPRLERPWPAHRRRRRCVPPSPQRASAGTSIPRRIASRRLQTSAAAAASRSSRPRMTGNRRALRQSSNAPPPRLESQTILDHPFRPRCFARQSASAAAPHPRDIAEAPFDRSPPRPRWNSGPAPRWKTSLRAAIGSSEQ